MAEGGVDFANNIEWSDNDNYNIQEQRDEVLAFQSLFELEADQRFTVINDGPCDITDNQLFSLQFLIPVKSPDSEITVKVCLPEADSCGNDLHKDVILQRSESRNEEFASFPVKCLSPLKLMAVLPPTYPAESPPIFTLSAAWLDGDQLSSLCTQLDKLWNECPSMPILNCWIDWLEYNTLSHLGINDTVFVQQYSDDDDDDVFDTRAVPGCDDIDDTINEMLRYNMVEEMAEFLRYDQECNICYCEKSGRDFYRFLPCKHHFCKECLTELAVVHVKEGTVQNLLCPEPKCSTEIRPCILKEILSDDEYQRWERLNLQHGLDMMGDITYCPKCQNVVVKEEDLGHCLSCMFTFCARCSEKWHQGEPCFFDKDIEESEEDRLNKEKENQEKHRKMQQQQEIKNSYKFMVERMKRCNCGAFIEKNGGCNKVTCTKCGHALCWLCGKDITKESYAHFSSSTRCAVANYINLPARAVPQHLRDIEVALTQRGENVERSVVYCPRCRQRNLRPETCNNHMKCWCCRVNFCFLCHNILIKPITQHFKASGCRQFTLIKE